MDLPDLGLIEVSGAGDVMRLGRLQTDVAEVVPAPLHRRVSPRLKDDLREEHKTWAEAGNAAGKRWTPFQGTAEALKRIVRRRGEVPFKDLIDELAHHYATDASARRSLQALIEQGVIPGVELRRDGGALLVVFKEEPDETH